MELASNKTKLVCTIGPASDSPGVMLQIHLNPDAVIVSTATGNEARLISRFKMPVWVAAVSCDAATCQGLQFSYGVQPVHVLTLPEDWNGFARTWVRSHGLPAGLAVFTEGPSANRPAANHRLDVIDLSDD